MFHLTRYRYLFFAISGVVILPGLLALIFWHLNLGIDFTNGTTVDLVFARNNVTTTQIASVFSQTYSGKHAQDVSVYASTNLKTAAKPQQTVFVQFSRPIGQTEEKAVNARLADPKYKLPTYKELAPDYQLTVGSNAIGQLVFQFDKPVAAADVTAALQNLPATDLPPTAGATTPTTPAPT
ncbi:MAG: hypothetical protein ACHQ4H_09510, partial [Ktedonobacterales bacterium]